MKKYVAYTALMLFVSVSAGIRWVLPVGSKCRGGYWCVNRGQWWGGRRGLQLLRRQQSEFGSE